jgi:heme-degrading monooxygenase HmoA
MIAVLTHHWARPSLLEEARRLLDGNGQAQGRFPGFVDRSTLLSLADPLQITTLVTLKSEADYDAWRASAERAAAMAGADDLWSRPPQSQRFEVAG